MRKQLLLLKALLVAVLLGVGTSAWAQVSNWTYSTTETNNTYASPFTGSTSGVVSVTLGSDASKWAVVKLGGKKTPYGVNDETEKLSFDATNTNVPTGGTFMAITPTRDLLFSLNWYAFDNVYMYLVDGSTNTKTQKARAKNAQTTSLGKLDAGKTYYVYGYNGVEDLGSARHFAFQGFTATTYEDYTIHYVDDSATPVTIKADRIVSGTSLYGATVSAEESDLENITYSGDTYAYQSGNTPITLSTSGNDITLVFKKATAASYKIQYKATIAGTPTVIKDEVVVESAIGSTVTASGSNFPTYITFGGVKYKYSSGNDPLTITGVEEDDVITLVYTPAPVFSYEVNAYDASSNKLGTIASGTYTEADEAITVGYPQYYLSGTTLYEIANNATGNYFAKTFTPDADDYEVQLVYSKGTLDNVVYFAEAEDLTGITTQNDGYTALRMSNGKAGYFESETAFTTLPAGSYTLTAATRAGSTTFYYGEVGSGTEALVLSSTGSVVKTTSEEFKLDAPTNIYTSVGAETKYFDYVIIQKTKENVEVSAAGFATYVNSDYDLDFSSTTIEAYKVKVSSKGLATLTKVNEVPAGTPVLLYANGSASESIPVMTGAAAVTDNDLVAGTTTTATDGVPTTDGDNTNMILNVVDEQIGFYFANDQTVATDRAYLHIASTLAPAAQQSRMKMVFAGETTGVKSLPTSQKGEESVYNLAGQRVKKPTKGLYVKGGKKVIVK